MVRFVRLGAWVLPLVALFLLSCGEDDSTSSSTPQPDLTIQSLSFTPTVPLAGQEIKLRATVRNSGNASAEISHVRMKVDQTLICGTTATPTLAPGDTMSYECVTDTLGVGAYQAGICADVLGLVMESNEENNCRAVPVEVAERTVPDLVAREIYFDPEAPDEGDEVTIKVRVYNYGTPTDTTWSEIRLDGQSTCGDMLTKNLERRGSDLLTCYVGKLPLGEHTVTVCVDKTNVEAESDEENNCVQQPLIIAPGQPDLIVSRIFWVPANPVSSDTIAFYAWIKNIGEGRAAASHLQFQISQFIHTPQALSALSAGDSVLVVGPERRLVSGTHIIVCTVDVQNEVPELIETNNREEYGMEIVPGKRQE